MSRPGATIATMTISLVLRVVPEALAAGRLAGQAELVGTGAVAVVRDAEELIAFLREHTVPPPSGAVEGTDDTSRSPRP